MLLPLHFIKKKGYLRSLFIFNKFLKNLFVDISFHHRFLNHHRTVPKSQQLVGL